MKKKLLEVAAFILLSIPAYTQGSVVNQTVARQENTLKGGSKTLAWIFTGGGAAMLVTGISLHGSKQSYSPNEEIGTALIIAGSASVLTAIVLFSTSAICRVGGKEMLLNLKIEKANTAEKDGGSAVIMDHYYPAFVFRLGL